jgi:hypothetical protein
MPFSEAQVRLLSSKLNEKVVRTRQLGGKGFVAPRHSNADDGARSLGVRCRRVSGPGSNWCSVGDVLRGRSAVECIMARRLFSDWVGRRGRVVCADYRRGRGD